MQYVIYNQETAAAEFYDSIEAVQDRHAQFIALYPHFATDLFDITVWQTNDDGTI